MVEEAVEVNFTLTRVANNHDSGLDQVLTESSADPGQEFEKLIKSLSSENGLQDLILSARVDLNLYRYHDYKDLSEALRGLHSNYPSITKLIR